MITGHIFICQAKEMVAVSKSISTKIKDKQGDITDDEVCASIYIRLYWSLLDDKRLRRPPRCCQIKL